MIVKISDFQIEALNNLIKLLDEKINKETIEKVNKNINYNNEELLFRNFNEVVKEIDVSNLNHLFSLYKDFSNKDFEKFSKEGEVGRSSVTFDYLLLKEGVLPILKDYISNELRINKTYFFFVLANELKRRLKNNNNIIGKDLEKEIDNNIKKNKKDLKLIIQNYIYKNGFNLSQGFLNNIPYYEELVKKLMIKKDNKKEENGFKYNPISFFSYLKDNEKNIINFLEINKNNKKEILNILEYTFNQSFIIDFNNIEEKYKGLSDRAYDMQSLLKDVFIKSIELDILKEEDLKVFFIKNPLLKNIIKFEYLKGLDSQKIQNDKDYENIKKVNVIFNLSNDGENKEKNIDYKLETKYDLLKYIYEKANEEELIAFFNVYKEKKVSPLFKSLLGSRFLSTEKESLKKLLTNVSGYSNEVENSFLISNIISNISKERLDFISKIILKNMLLKNITYNNATSLFLDNLPVDYSYKESFESVVKESKNQKLFDILNAEKDNREMKDQYIERKGIKNYNRLMKNRNGYYVQTLETNSMKINIDTYFRGNLNKIVHNIKLFEDDNQKKAFVEKFKDTFILEKYMFKNNECDGFANLFFENVVSKIKNNEGIIDFLNIFGLKKDMYKDSSSNINKLIYLYININLLKSSIFENKIQNSNIDLSQKEIEKLKDSIKNQKEIIDGCIVFLKDFKKYENVVSTNIRVETKKDWLVSLVQEYIKSDKNEKTSVLKNNILSLLNNNDLFTDFDIKKEEIIYTLLNKDDLLIENKSFSMIANENPLLLENIISYFDKPLEEEYKNKDNNEYLEKENNINNISVKIFDVLTNKDNDIIFNKEEKDFILENYKKIEEKVLNISKTKMEKQYINKYIDGYVGIVFDSLLRYKEVDEEFYIKLVEKNSNIIKKEYIYHSMLDLIFANKINDIESVKKMIENIKEQRSVLIKKISENKSENIVEQKASILINYYDYDNNFNLEDFKQKMDKVLEINKFLINLETIKKEEVKYLVINTLNILKVEKDIVKNMEENYFGSTRIINEKIDNYKDIIFDKRYNLLDDIKINNERVLESGESGSYSYNFKTESVIKEYKYRALKLKDYSSFEEYLNDISEKSINKEILSDDYMFNFDDKLNVLSIHDLVFHNDSNKNAIEIGFEKHFNGIDFNLNVESISKLIEVVVANNLLGKENNLTEKTIEYLKNNIEISKTHRPSEKEENQKYRERIFSINSENYEEYKVFDRSYEKNIEIYRDRTEYRYMKMNDNIYKNYSYGENSLGDKSNYYKIEEDLKKLTNGYRLFKEKYLDKLGFDHDFYIDLIPLAFTKNQGDIEKYKKCIYKKSYLVDIFYKNNVAILNPKLTGVFRSQLETNLFNNPYNNSSDNEYIKVSNYLDNEIGFVKTINETISNGYSLDKEDVIKLFYNSIRNINYLIEYMDNEIIVENKKIKLKELYFEYLKDDKLFGMATMFKEFLLTVLSTDTNNEKNDIKKKQFLEEFISSFNDSKKRNIVLNYLITVKSWAYKLNKDSLEYLFNLGLKLAKEKNYDIKEVLFPFCNAITSVNKDSYNMVEIYLNEVLNLNNINPKEMFEIIKSYKRIGKYELYKEKIMNYINTYIEENKKDKKKIDFFLRALFSALAFMKEESYLKEIENITKDIDVLNFSLNYDIVFNLKNQNCSIVEKIEEKKESINVDEKDKIDLDYSKHFTNIDYRFLFEKEEELKEMYNEFLMNPIAIKYKEQKEEELLNKRNKVEESIKILVDGEKNYDLVSYNNLQEELENIQLEFLQLKKQIASWFKDINIKNDIFFSCIKKIENKRITIDNFDIEKFKKLKEIFNIKVSKISIEDFEYVFDVFSFMNYEGTEIKEINKIISFFLKKDIGYNNVKEEKKDLQSIWDKSLLKKLTSEYELNDIPFFEANKDNNLIKMKRLFSSFENVFFSKYFKAIHGGLDENMFLKENKELMDSHYKIENYFFENINMFYDLDFNQGKLEEFFELEKEMIDFYYKKNRFIVERKKTLYELRHNDGFGSFLNNVSLYNEELNDTLDENIKNERSKIENIKNVRYIVDNIMPYFKEELVVKAGLDGFLKMFPNMINILEKNKEYLIKKHINILEKNVKNNNITKSGYELLDVLDVCNKKYLANMIEEEITKVIIPKELKYACGTNGETIGEYDIRKYVNLFKDGQKQHNLFKEKDEKYPFYFYKSIEQDKDGYFTMSQVLPSMNHQTTTWGISTGCCYTINGAASSLLKNVPLVPEKYFSFIRTKILVKELPEELLKLLEKYNKEEDYNIEKEELEEKIFDILYPISINVGAAISYLDSKNNIIFDNYEGGKIYIKKKDETGNYIIDENTNAPSMIRVSSVGEDVVNGLEECVSVLKSFNNNIKFAGLGLNYTKLDEKVLCKLKNPKEEEKFFPDEYPPTKQIVNGETKISYDKHLYSDFDRGCFKIVEEERNNMNIQEIIEKINKNIQKYSKNKNKEENILEYTKNKNGIQGEFKF
jgi:hypothetical protein